jgi:hypothetical protein
VEFATAGERREDQHLERAGRNRVMGRPGNHDIDRLCYGRLRRQEAFC